MRFLLRASSPLQFGVGELSRVQCLALASPAAAAACGASVGVPGWEGPVF